MMAKILVILENAKGKIVGLTKECLTVVQSLSSTMNADVEGVILGIGIGDLAAEAGKFGVKKVYKVDDPQFSGVNILYHTRTIEVLIKEANPTLVIAGASLYGQELMPRLAARFNKAIEMSVLLDNDPPEWFRVCTQWTRKTHQAGFCLSVTLFWLRFDFTFFDKRSWDYNNNKYKEQEQESPQFRYF